MLFNSFDFCLFFAIVLVGQRILPHRARNVFLLIASWLFYATWDWRFLGLILFTITVEHALSHAIYRSQISSVRKGLLCLSVVVNLGILAFFKYANFFIESAAELVSSLGFEPSLPALRVILPVGISFYTFQVMSYTIDVYRRELVPLSRWSDFALYVSLFPQLVAGPIERGTHLAGQITRKTIPDLAAVHDGAWLILKGLFKKVVIADNLAPIVDTVFRQSAPSGPEVMLGVYAFAFQIYGDFSGYTDMARGIGKWMGYDLMLNFRVPYFATSPSDFWRRWHISLSSWLRDYLYIPLGGSHCPAWRANVNLLATMILGGLWHGAAWTFVLWGAFHGFLLVVYRSWERRRARHEGASVPAADPVPRWQEGLPRNASSGGKNATAANAAPLSLRWWVQVVVMFHLVCLGWLMFRAESLQQLTTMVHALTVTWAVPDDFYRRVWVVLFLCLPLILNQLAQEVTGNLQFVRTLSFLPRTAIYSAMVLGILALGNFGGREFIYFQF